jgi:hypothetical protein
MHILSGLLPGHVLQRTPRGGIVSITGTVEASGTVTASITAKGKALSGWKSRAVGRAAKGGFTAKLSGIPVGGPYVVTLRVGTTSLAVRDIFVGDLWLMAGQSNMQGIGNMVDAAKPHPLVRNFSMGLEWELARDPLHYLQESPDSIHNSAGVPTREEAAKGKKASTKGVGVGVFFGVEMHRRTGVPQGLIATAHGGTSMEQWDPAKKGLAGASLYGSMLLALRRVAQPVAGVLWYQGESDTNASCAAVYTKRMQDLVASIRADLRQAKLPVITVQIGRFVCPPGGEREWNQIQELQRLLPKHITKLAVVPSIDLELDDLIHISAKSYRLLGKRMAAAASRLVHGEAQPPEPAPLAARVIPGRITGPTIEVTFTNVVGGLQAPGLPSGFTMVDHEHRAVEQIYKTTLEEDRVILELVSPSRLDLQLMYGHGRNPHCTITDGRGAGLPVFGPMRIQGYDPVSPWLVHWEVSPILPGEEIDTLPPPRTQDLPGMQPRSWENGAFVNMHDLWQGHSGHAVLSSVIQCPEAMQLQLRTGYDGPIRIWIDDQEVHRDLAGTNPALEDAQRILLTLEAGDHRITVIMALNQGKAWGFFMRFARVGLSDAVMAGGTPIVLPMPRR